MSRGSFSAANFLRLSSAPITAAPLTMAAWCWTTETATGQTIIWLGQSTEAGAASRDQFRLSTDAAAHVQVTTGGNTASNAAQSTSTYVASTWFHAAGVFGITTGTDRAAFLNGGGKGSSTTDMTPSGIDRISIGLRDNTFLDQPFGGTGTGYIAWPAIWNTNLTDAEIATLASGIPPWMVRPENLVAPWILDGDGDEPSWWPGGYTMVEQGTLPVGPHNPPIVMPFSFSRSRSISEVTTGGGGGGPAAQDYYLLRARRRGRR